METQKYRNFADAIEGALAELGDVNYCLHLYVAGKTLQSIRAIEAIKKICEEHLQDHYELEVIDIYQQPELAGKANIIAVPTLIKSRPHPSQRMVGNMSNTEKTIQCLAISPKDKTS